MRRIKLTCSKINAPANDHGIFFFNFVVMQDKNNYLFKFLFIILFICNFIKLHYKITNKKDKKEFRKIIIFKIRKINKK